MYPQQSYIRAVRLLGNCGVQIQLSFDNVSYFIELPFFPFCLVWNRFLFARGNVRYLDSAKGDRCRTNGIRGSKKSACIPAVQLTPSLPSPLLPRFPIPLTQLEHFAAAVSNSVLSPELFPLERCRVVGVGLKFMPTPKFAPSLSQHSDFAAVQ